jgi:hypothetical protein
MATANLKEMGNQSLKTAAAASKAGFAVLFVVYKRKI